MKTQKLSEAEDLASTARTRREKSIGVENQPYLSDLDLLFAVYYASGKTEEAALQLLQAAELQKKTCCCEPPPIFLSKRYLTIFQGSQN